MSLRPMTWTNKSVLGTAAVMLAAACGGVHHDASVAGAATLGTTGGTCPVRRAAKPIGHTGASATLALASIAGRRVALVADEDAKAILTVDLETQKEIARTSLGTAPSQIYIANDGRIFVTLRQKNELVVLGATRADAPLEPGCSAATAAEPIAIAATPDGRAVAVTSGWGRTITVFDSTSLAVKSTAYVAREPRSIVIADDGKTAFVSHAVGSLVSRVDLASAKTDEIGLRGWGIGVEPDTAKARSVLHAHGTELPVVEKREAGEPTCQGFALAKSTGRIFAPQVAVDPGDADQRPDGYGDPNEDTESPAISVIDESNGHPLLASMRKSTNPLGGPRNSDPRSIGSECLLPRAAAVDPTTQSLLVTCYGIDAVVAYDATAANPLAVERRRWSVGAGPSGIVVDPQRHEAVVWSQFDRTVSTFPIGGKDVVDEKTLAITKTRLEPLKDGPSPAYVLGRVLFHAAGDRRISHDGRACASCHPDGRDDAITWATPEGPRRSIMLAGRVGETAPYSWNGTESTIAGHLASTFDRLSGQGIRSIELDALTAYFSAMPAPVATATKNAKVERGKKIFASTEAGCASCHSGASYTDGLNHDVGSKLSSDRTAAFNTPSLHLVDGTGPYFHDGRYATLHDLLVRSDGTMGHTKHLTNDDLDALESFLRTL